MYEVCIRSVGEAPSTIPDEGGGVESYGSSAPMIPSCPTQHRQKYIDFPIDYEELGAK